MSLENKTGRSHHLEDKKQHACHPRRSLWTVTYVTNRSQSHSGQAWRAASAHLARRIWVGWRCCTQSAPRRWCPGRSTSAPGKRRACVTALLVSCSARNSIFTQEPLSNTTEKKQWFHPFERIQINLLFFRHDIFLTAGNEVSHKMAGCIKLHVWVVSSIPIFLIKTCVRFQEAT